MKKNLDDELRNIARKSLKEEVENIAKKNINVIVKESIVKDGILNTDYAKNHFKEHERLVLEKGIYSLDKQLLVPKNKTLEIAPGTKIIFQEAKDKSETGRIHSEGLLRAKGNTQPILFVEHNRPDELSALVNIIGSGSNGSMICGATFVGFSDKNIGIASLLDINETNVDISFCNFRNGAATFGGGVYIGKSKGVFAFNEIENCKASLNGGGLYVQESDIVIEKNTISHCNSNNGGGIYVFRSPNIKIVTNKIALCWADVNGGGIYVRESDKILITNNEIDNCKAPSDAWELHAHDSEQTERYTSSFGGGFYICESSGTLNKNTIKNNRSDRGGGVYLDRSTSFALEDNNIANNTAKLGGGLLIFDKIPLSDTNLSGFKDNTFVNNINNHIIYLNDLNEFKLVK